MNNSKYLTRNEPINANPEPAYARGRATEELIIDWYLIAGHVTPCPRCGKFLTSLYLCPGCGIRYELVVPNPTLANTDQKIEDEK
jgi:hypothetical protein